MDQAIQDFINGKRIAVVGVSREASKFGCTAFTELAARGYQVFAVHPEAKEIAGASCYPNLAALKGQVDGALVVVSPHQATSIKKAHSQFLCAFLFEVPKQIFENSDRLAFLESTLPENFALF